MKKKLIAIVASLAMVATMVPASAFATDEPVKATKIDMSGVEAEVAPQSELDAAGAALPAELKTLLEESNEYVTGEFSKGTLKLTGSVPYKITTGDQFSSVDSLKEGNYLAISFKNMPRTAADTTTLATMVPCPLEIEETLYQGTRLDTTDVGAGANEYKHGEVMLFLPRLTKGKNLTYTVAFLSNGATEAEGVEAFDWANGVYFSASEIAKMPSAAQADKKQLTKLETALNKSAKVAGHKTLTIDVSGLKLLTKSETAAMDGFIAAIERIDAADGNNGSPYTPDVENIDKNDKVTTAYKQEVTAARAIYDGLDAELKAIIESAVTASKTTVLKTAYKALITAEDNVKSYNTLTEVAALVAGLPAADKLDLTDAAAVKQVKTAEAAVEALAPGAKAILLTTDEYLTANQRTNYNNILAVINETSVKAVIEAIEALPKLPVSEFANKEAIDAVFAPMTAAEKALEALTEPQQASVTNKSTLEGYRADYDKLIKAYVDPIYAEAAKIDVEKAMSAEEKALVTELKAYVEGDYIATKNIAKFDQDTYDALVAALDKVAKDEISLENATIAAIADQAYTGKAIEPAVTVTDKAGKEVAAEEYTVIYSNNKDAGTATVTVAAKSSSAYTGSVSATFTIKPAALTADMVKVANATYTGKALKPAVSVASGVDYTVAYKNNTAVGKASAVVTGTGNYTGTITKNFIVKPAKESITSLKAGKKQITVAYKAQTGAKYRVICKASGLKAIGTNTTATKKTVKKLKSGKTYQVKVRAYKAVDGKTYYGTYSAVKKVKVK